MEFSVVFWSWWRGGKGWAEKARERKGIGEKYRALVDASYDIQDSG